MKVFQHSTIFNFNGSWKEMAIQRPTIVDFLHCSPVVFPERVDSIEISKLHNRKLITFHRISSNNFR